MTSVNQTLRFYDLCRQAAERKGVRCSLDAPPAPVSGTESDSTSVESEKGRKKQDPFTAEARQTYNHIISLQSYLATIRPSYLNVSTHGMLSSYSSSAGSASLRSSNRALTNAQRDEIDYESRLIIQRCTNRVRDLENLAAQAAKADAQMTGPTSVKASLARLFIKDDEDAGGRKTLAMHRRGMTQMLNKLLKEVSEMQTELQEVRLSRDNEKAKSMLNSRAAGGTYGGGASSLSEQNAGQQTAITMQELLSEEHQKQDAELGAMTDPVLLQQLETENAALLAEFQERLEQAQQAEKSLYEIASLQGELAAHLAEQAEVTEALYNDSVDTMGVVESANKELLNARQRNRLASKIIIAMALFLAFFLLFVDYATS
ncbi:hypothetical protein BZA70DRAFT_200868 [Myxozyma melibiosi]|uniref:t-SNARE coiled-coil homology domain-containing protein n=1 Tax=Myxozyma melibiosi TaxID=54550 RepID=A0ABR1F2R8_9ASCO